MAIVTDREGKAALTRIIGRRLASARKMARLRQENAASEIGHKNITQVSLAESGERLLPLNELVKLARLYAVPLDWLVGVIDDPLADPFETNPGVILHTVTSTMRQNFEAFTRAVAENTAIAVSGQRQDRLDLKDMSRMAREAKAQLKRLAELNPAFEEELKGLATLYSTIGKMVAMAERADCRIGEEERLVSEIDRNMRLEEIEPSAKQFMLLLD